MARVLATGSRSLTDRRLVWFELDAVAASYASRGMVLVHGDCPDGFDALADAWAVARGIEREPHAAVWDSCTWDCPRGHRRWKRRGDRVHPGMLADYCPGAGPRRNGLMVGLGAEVCVAAPVGSSYGTRDCMRRAAAAGIPVRNLGAQR